MAFRCGSGPSGWRPAGGGCDREDDHTHVEPPQESGHGHRWVRATPGRGVGVGAWKGQAWAGVPEEPRGEGKAQGSIWDDGSGQCWEHGQEQPCLSPWGRSPGSGSGEETEGPSHPFLFLRGVGCLRQDPGNTLSFPVYDLFLLCASVSPLPIVAGNSIQVKLPPCPWTPRLAPCWL